MRIAGIIPARYNSSRLPGKPLIKIAGKTMICRVYEQVKKSKLIDYIAVATDDKRIYDHVRTFGGEAIMTSENHISGTDRIIEALKKIDCNIVVNIQGDEPFIDPENIDKAITPLLEDKKINVSTLAVKINNLSEIFNPNIVKVVFDKYNFAIYFSRGVMPFINVDKSSPVSSKIMFNHHKHIGLYVYRKNFLKKFATMEKSNLELIESLEQLRIIENGEKIKVVLTDIDSFSVDTPNDIKQIKESLKKIKNKFAGTDRIQGRI